MAYGVEVNAALKNEIVEMFNSSVSNMRQFLKTDGLWMEGNQQLLRDLTEITRTLQAGFPEIECQGVPVRATHPMNANSLAGYLARMVEHIKATPEPLSHNRKFVSHRDAIYKRLQTIDVLLSHEHEVYHPALSVPSIGRML